VWYNVYWVFFTQRSGVTHEAIALVPAQNEDQGAGRFYHVVGNVGIGTRFERRPGFDFAKSRSYIREDFVFQLPRAALDQFEAITVSLQPPHDPRVLYGDILDPPARDCSDWVDDVLYQARTLGNGSGA
jgi:hypothetical protein